MKKSRVKGSRAVRGSMKVRRKKQMAPRMPPMIMKVFLPI